MTSSESTTYDSGVTTDSSNPSNRDPRARRLYLFDSELHRIAALGFLAPFNEWVDLNWPICSWTFNIRESSGTNFTPLTLAIDQVGVNDGRHRRHDIIRYGMEDGENCPLASREERTELIRTMLKLGADADDLYGRDKVYKAASVTDMTPLITAIVRDYVELIPILVEYGANTEFEWTGRTALHIAAEEVSVPAINALLHANADPNSRTWLWAHEHIYIQHSWFPRPFVRQVYSSNHGTPLHTLAFVPEYRNLHGENQPEPSALNAAVRSLLQHGSDINIVDSYRKTALEVSTQQQVTGPILWEKRKWFLQLVDGSGCDLVGNDHVTHYLFNSFVVKDICWYMW